MKISRGLQRIKTPDGYVQPLNIENSGLPYIPMCPYTDNEWETYHILSRRLIMIWILSYMMKA